VIRFKTPGDFTKLQFPYIREGMVDIKSTASSLTPGGLVHVYVEEPNIGLKLNELVTCPTNTIYAKPDLNI